MQLKMKTCPEALSVDLGQAALIIVDMQNAFAEKGGVFDLAGIDTSQASRVIQVIRNVLEAARCTGMKIIYLQMGYSGNLSDSGGPDSPNWHKEFALLLMRHRPELGEKLLTEGTWNFAIVDELKPHSTDLVLRKSRYSGFAGTDLDSLLRAGQIRFLFFVGMATNVCVESTLRDAYCLDYWPILIRDATMQAGPAFLQEATIQNVENYFGWTMTSQEFIGNLTTV